MNDRQLLIEGITKDMIQYLMEDYGMDLQAAFRKLYNSETYEKLQDERTGLPPLYDTEHGFGLRIGYEVARVQVNVSYKVAVSNLLDENTTPGVSMYPHTASIGLAYRFGAL